MSTAKEFAQKTGLSESGISNAIKRNSIPFSFCADVAMTYGIPLDWLIFGDVDGSKHYRLIEPEFFNRIYRHADFNIAAEKPVISAVEINGIIMVPAYDIPVNVVDGDFWKEEYITQKIPFNVSWLQDHGLSENDLVCLQVNGDEMMPSLGENDIALITRKVKQGNGVFALRVGHTISIKRLQYLIDGTLRISSDNPLYESEIIDPAQMGSRLK